MHPDLHAQHDPLVVAAAADRAGFLPPELADCPDCRALHADLLALAAATPDSAVPARPRPFTLSAADADRLRRPSWRRWFASIGSTRDTLSRPLAYGLTTLGLVGLLLTAGPNLMPSGAATQILAPVGPDVVESAAAAPGVGGTTNRAPQEAPLAAPSDAGFDTTGGSEVEKADALGPQRQDADGAIPPEPLSPDSGTPPDDAVTLDADDGANVGFVLAGIMLIVGLGILGLRWSSRRLGDR
jgi:hypothetical protein